MNEEAAALRRSLAAIGRAKCDALSADIRAHLELTPGERLLLTLRHGDAHLRAFPDHPDGVADADAEAWRRVRRRVAGR